MTRKTDSQGRLMLPRDFASCLVNIERIGNELRIRKVQQSVGRRYSFKQLMAGVTEKNLHTGINTDPPRGVESL